MRPSADSAIVDGRPGAGGLQREPTSNEGDTTTYVYDPAGRRMAKAFDGQVAVRYVYDGDHCIAEYDADDVLLRRFIYGPGVDQPICMIEADGPYAGAYYYHFDGLGSVVALSDASGDTVQTYEYSVFGRPAAADPNHPNPYLFTARRFDPETGLYHYRARAYNPYIGRFLQTDPAGQGMNWYAYCGNNATNYVDPSGLHYGFLRQDHPKAVKGKLTLAWRDHGEVTRVGSWTNIWDFIEQGVAGNITEFDPKYWDKTKQPGWKLSGWFVRGRGDTDTRERWFWRLKAISFLQPTMDMLYEDIEAGPKITIRKGTTVAYYPGTRELHWNENTWYIYGGPNNHPHDYQWWKSHPLALLAHELTHAHQHAIGMSGTRRDLELFAMHWENWVRGNLFYCDPTISDLYPRRAYWQSSTTSIVGGTPVTVTRTDFGPTAAAAWLAFDTHKVVY